MDSEKNSEPTKPNFDISVIEYNLSLTPEERIENHEAARELMLDLREAGKKHYEAQSQSPT